MKKSGAGAVLLLALVMITGLSVLYWQDVGERLVTANAGGGGGEIPIYAAETREPQISFSIQVKGSNESVSKIRKALKEKHVRATFFVDGGWVKKYPEDVRAILEEGHELGSNGEQYMQMTELSERECRKQIRELDKQVKEKYGYEMSLFSPPYGVYNDSVVQSICACGYYPVCWSVDSMDWKNYGKQDTVTRILENENLQNGAIIHWNTNGKYTAASMEKVVDLLQQRGYEIVPVSRMLGEVGNE